MMREIQLGDILINQDSSPYIIAEIGVNHEGSLSKAKDLIELAKAGGAHAAKFQTYKAKTLAAKNSPSYWDLTKEPTTSQFELFKKYDGFGEKEYIELAEHCKKNNIAFVSTPFDASAVDFLATLVPFFKIASADLTNTPFLRQIAHHHKPVILSTGCATLGEIDYAIDTLKKGGCKQIALLHCILNYPTPNEFANLRMIEHLAHSYPELIIGYSDHTLPDPEMRSLITSYLLGARIVEKHFTNDKSLPGNDHYHAMDKQDCLNFISRVKHIELLLGDSTIKQPLPSEKLSIRNARRSIVIEGGVRKGDKLSEKNITYKRPGTGISPIHWDDVIGKTVTRDLEDDHILQWSDLENA
jgi:sialic acid synthase SpsE